MRKIEENLLTHRTIYLNLSLQERTTGLDEIVKDLSSFFNLPIYFWNLSKSHATPLKLKGNSAKQTIQKSKKDSRNNLSEALSTTKAVAEKCTTRTFDDIITALIDIYEQQHPAIYIVENADRLITSNSLNIFQYELLQTWIVKLAQKSRRETDFYFVLLGTTQENWFLNEIAPRVELPYMKVDEIASILSNKFAQLNLKDSDKDRLIDKAKHILLGMSQPELLWGVDNITNSLKNNNTVAAYIKGLLEYKKQKLKNLGLNFLPQTNIGDIGGMDILKQYIDRLEIEFTAEARKYNIPIPQGWALVGVPGAGKSLSAKVLAQKLSLPIIHLPIEEVQNKGSIYLSRILKLAEANAPNILFIDELEKLFPDGQKMDKEAATTLGVFLTWLQEKTAPCFVMVTLNRLDNLPPELIRAGRFSEVFYAGFPQPIERQEIYKLHLSNYDSRYKEDILERQQWQDLIEESVNFTGAEIGSVVEKAYRQKFLERTQTKKELNEQLYKTSESLISSIESGYNQQIEKIKQRTIVFDHLDREISILMTAFPEIAEEIDLLYGQLLDMSSQSEGEEESLEVRKIKAQLNQLVHTGYANKVRHINQRTISLRNIDAKVSQAMSDLPESADTIDEIYDSLCQIRENIERLEAEAIEIDFETLLKYTNEEIPLYERNVEKVMAIENRARKICKPVSSKDNSHLTDNEPSFWKDMKQDEVKAIIEKYGDRPSLTPGDIEEGETPEAEIENILSKAERETTYFWA